MLHATRKFASLSEKLPKQCMYCKGVQRSWKAPKSKFKDSIQNCRAQNRRNGWQDCFSYTKDHKEMNFSTRAGMCSIGHSSMSLLCPLALKPKVNLHIHIHIHIYHCTRQWQREPELKGPFWT